MRTYTINDTEVTVEKNSLSYNDRLNERSTCSFTVVDPDFDITVGMEVVITDGTDHVFSGSIDGLSDYGDTIRYFAVTCVDFSQLIDTRVIAETYEDTSAGDIVRDFIDQVFSEEGITEGDIQNGPTISKAVFNYLDGNEAMNDLGDITGFSWNIDKDKKLNFFDRGIYAAPFSLTDSSANYQDLRVKKTRSKYRNRQYVRAGQDISDERIESFLGDGKLQTFVLSLPVAAAPTITLNGSAQTVGIQGVDTGKQWYWNKGRNEISQEPSDTAIDGADTLAVTYQGLFPIIVVADSGAGINERKVAEGGSGIYEAVEEQPNIDTSDAALEFAQGKLQKYGIIPRTVTFNTYTSGLKSGQLLSITNTKHNLDDRFLIESVTARNEDTLTLYTVKCLDGQAVGGWEQVFKTLAQGQKRLVIRDNEVLVKLKTFAETLSISDALTISKAAPESRIGHALIGFSEVA